MSLPVWPGRPFPLGATFDGHGVNFAVFSQHATAVDLCLFAPLSPNTQTERVPLPSRTNHVFHGYVPGLMPGALYGLRAHGPWAPQDGHRFNPKKLLVDPYARALVGKPDPTGPLVGHTLHHGAETPDATDSAPFMPRCQVVDPAFDWGKDAPPRVPAHRTVLYEAHVKGLTALHPKVPARLRGTYAGLGHKAVVDHLLGLGVTTVELLPIHESVTEAFLAAKGLTNFWGYNTLGFFAPDQRFASKGGHASAVAELKHAIKALHAAGVEVVLDVVFNHTAEGNHEGPTLAFRGLDNASYYWLDPSKRARHRDFTGCGNSLNLSHPRVLQLVLDSLRAWVTEFHVDGFRLDLASTLGRVGDGAFHEGAPFFAAVAQDPVLSTVKLFAEPWDVGEGGYRLGSFGVPFAEWNDRFRDTVRRFWRGDLGQVPPLASRLTGSSDYFELSGRKPSASVNFVTCHDGFTLVDLTSYAHKHNEANLEDNRDGTNDNLSANWGVEGPSDDPAVEALRARVRRSLLATLFVSAGTPMLLAGDELLRTQRGNNNAYCQDGPLSFVAWRDDASAQAMLAFTKRLLTLRAAHPALHRLDFFTGRKTSPRGHKDVVWLGRTGKELKDVDWTDAGLLTFGAFLSGEASEEVGPRGERHPADSLLLYLNGAADDVQVSLPSASYGRRWRLLLDTSVEAATGEPVAFADGATVTVAGKALVLLQKER